MPRRERKLFDLRVANLDIINIYTHYKSLYLRIVFLAINHS
jgi:hypothetical protein